MRMANLGRTSAVIALAGLALSTASLFAADVASDAVVVSQGAARITLADVDAFAERLPPGSSRAGFFDNAKRLDSTLKSLLLNRTLAGEARALGLDKDPQVQRQVELAVEEALMRARMAQFRAMLTIPDFTDLAREKYTADKQTYLKPAVVNVRHLLVSTEKHVAADARRIAEQARAKAVANPSGFEAVVMEYSEDPSKDDNKGLMMDATGGRYVAEFAEAAKQLKKAGDVSPIVKTTFGYHVLVLMDKVPEKLPTFAEVGPGIVAQLTAEYVQNQVAEHLGKAQVAPIESNSELVASLRTRYKSLAGGSGDAAEIQSVPSQKP